MSLRVLAVTDGRPASAGVARLAAELAAHRDATVRVLGVLAPLPLPSGMAASLPHAAEMARAREDEMLHRVRHQLDDLGASAEAWRIATVEGGVADALESAGRTGADVVLVPRNGIESVACGGELLALVRGSRSPVALVGPELQKLPRRAVVGVDFGSSSAAVARAAAMLVGTSGRIRLTHVMPRLDFPAAALWGWTDCYVGSLPAQFARLRDSIGDADGLELEDTVIEGEPVSHLLQIAAADEADLLALGSISYTFRDRVAFCGVPGQLARRFKGALMLVPPRDAAARRKRGRPAVRPHVAA